MPKRKNKKQKTKKNTSMKEATRIPEQDKYAYGSFSFDEYEGNNKVDVKRIRMRREMDVSRITPKNRSRLVLGFAVILLLMTAQFTG